MFSTRKLYASVTATANDAAHIDILRSGKIRGIEWSVYSSGALATGDVLSVELSTASTSQQSTNDTSGVLSMFGIGGSLTAAGGPVLGAKYVGPTGIAVKSGDRLYLNAVEAGANTWSVSCIIHIDD